MSLETLSDAGAQMAGRSLRPSMLHRPIVLLLIVGGHLAVSTVLAKAAPQLGWHPLALLQWATLGAAMTLFVGTRVLMRDDASVPAPARRPDRTGFARYLAVSGTLYILPNVIAFMAAPRVGAGFVALCYAFPLVLTYALAVVIGLERFRLVRALGVGFGLAGAALLATSGKSLAGAAPTWAVAALTIPFFLAVGNIYRTLRWPAGVRPADLAVGMMAVGFAVLALYGQAVSIPLSPSSWSVGAVGLLVAQIAVFALQFSLYFRLQQAAGPVYLSQIGSVAAMFGLVLGAAIYGETPNAAMLGAAGAVGAGVFLVSWRR